MKRISLKMKRISLKMKRFVLIIALLVVPNFAYGVGVSYSICDMTLDSAPIASDEIEIQGTGCSAVVEKTTLGDVVNDVAMLRTVTTQLISTGIGAAVGAGEYVKILLPADESIVIDGSTNARTIDTGAFRMEHKPTIENNRPITLNIDVNSQANTHGVFVDIITTGLVAGEVVQGLSVLVDKSTSTGGTIRALSMDSAGVGSANSVTGHAGVGVNVISQLVGTFGNLEQVPTESGGFYVDITTASAATGTDATMFAVDNDALYLGDAATFNELEFNLETVASGAGIKPTFEFSIAGPGWTVFTPADDTNGMRLSADIFWVISELSSWAATATPPALGSVTITGGSVSAGVNKIDGITVDAVEVMNGSEDFDTDNATTAAAVAASIVAKTSSPNYTAYSTGAVITIQAVATGTGPNTFVVATDEQGDVTVTDVNLAGGTADKYQIRITRTQNTISTPPVEDTIQITSAVEYGWDLDGKITASELNIDTLVTGSPIINYKQAGTVKAFIKYADSGDNFLLDSDGSLQLAPGNVVALSFSSAGNATFSVNCYF